MRPWPAPAGCGGGGCHRGCGGVPHIRQPLRPARSATSQDHGHGAVTSSRRDLDHDHSAVMVQETDGPGQWASTIMPAATVVLVDSSMRMKPPVRRFLA